MGILSAFRFAFQNVFFTPLLYGVIASLAIFSATWEKGDRLKDQLTDPFRNQKDTFDFIIVGGGSSGSVLAYRLSKYHTVLLLEAGGESHPFQAIPALSLFIPNYPATDWSHKSVRQTSSCLACVDKKYTFSQGKNLGGSGNLNYLIHLRGSPKDYDNWARITGDNKWTYDHVLGDFTASENFVGTTTDATAHGVGGPLQIEMPDEIGLANEWNWAGQEMGYPHLDLNGKYDEGFDALYYPTKRGIRQATYRAFIQPVRHRSSLVVRKFAHVNKVLIRDDTNFAYGVQYDRHGQSVQAFANKEVILSAGTLQTPKLLMLSGIGPTSVLENFGIPVKSDLPVGKGLQDHISTLLGPFFINSPKTFSYDDDVTPKSFLQFIQQGTGPLTTSGFQATALLVSSLAKARGQVGWPDIQLTLLGLAPHRLFNSDIAHAFGLEEAILQRHFPHARGKSAFFIVVTVARPESLGEVCIESANPYKPLTIDPRYFSDPEDKDMKVMVEGIHRALHLAENTTVFQNCGVKLLEKCFPGCEGHVYRSNAYWECYVRHLTLTLNDHVGTAQMGYRSSPYGVVDSDLKVMGVHSLRVVDASVMPTIVGTNTQAATIMIGEKASSLILQEWADTAVNHDGNGYGPPPLPEYGPPPATQYGPPPSQDYGTQSLPPQQIHTQNPSQNSVVVDDSLGSLTPPGLPGPGPTYQNYDSFDLLRSKGLESVQSISLHGGTLEHSSSSIPSPTPILHFSSPITSIEESTTSSTSEDLFTTPHIYQEVYDPTTPFPSYREGKDLDISNVPDNLLADEHGEAITLPSTTEESVLARGPNGSSLILRKRKKLPPNVTVNPRGHLGFDDEDRVLRVKSTPATPFSTSVEPLPKNYVVIKQRRPRIRRKRPHPENGKQPTNSDNIVEDPTPTQNSSLSPNSKSVVSAVKTRLRNFIPPTRGKRGNTSFSGRGQEQEVQEQEVQEQEVQETSKYSSRSGEGDTDMSVDSSDTTEVSKDIVGNELKMVVLNDVDLKKEDKKSREIKGGDQDHPMMPMDMDPLPKIIASSSSSSNRNYLHKDKSSHNRKLVSLSRFNSAENRKARMAKFVRTTRNKIR